MRNRIIAAAVTAAAALGLVLGGSLSASAAPVIANISYLVVAHTPFSTGRYCAAVLLSEQIKSAGPPYVSGYVENIHVGKPCLGWVERSANGGKTWSVSSSVVRAPSTPGFTDFVKLGEQKDGPALRARACYQAGAAGPVHCTRGVSLKASSAPADGFPVRLSYLRAVVPLGTSTSGECFAYVSTTTTVKKAGTLADGFFVAFGATCTGYEQTSADGGVTWTTVSREFTFSSTAPATVWAFTGVHPDGTGRLARACVVLGAGKAHCTTAW